MYGIEISLKSGFGQRFPRALRMPYISREKMKFQFISFCSALRSFVPIPDANRLAVRPLAHWSGANHVSAEPSVYRYAPCNAHYLTKDSLRCRSPSHVCGTGSQENAYCAGKYEVASHSWASHEECLRSSNAKAHRRRADTAARERQCT